MHENETQQTICILGCGGFIGSHLLDRLLYTTSYRILGIDVDAKKIEQHLSHQQFTFIKQNVSESDALGQYIEQSDIVISLAAICNPALYNTKPLRVIHSNFTSHLELLKMCTANNSWLIHFSTCEVYGKTIAHFLKNEDTSVQEKQEYVLLNEDRTPHILGPVQAQRWSYANAKQLLERMIFAYSFEQGLDYTIIRPFNFIGPRMDFLPEVDGEGVPRVLACFMDALLFNKPLKLVNGGQNRRTFTYIDDAIDGVCAVLKNPDTAKQQIFNIGNPQNETSIAGLAELMIEIYAQLASDSPYLSTENVSAKDFYGEGYEDSDRRVPDISKAERLLSWYPRIDLTTALRHTIEAYIKKYGNAKLPQEVC